MVDKARCMVMDGRFVSSIASRKGKVIPRISVYSSDLDLHACIMSTSPIDPLPIPPPSNPLKKSVLFTEGTLASSSMASMVLEGLPLFHASLCLAKTVRLHS